MRDSDLWVYEGFTQFWGFTLAARSGFSTREQYLDHLAGDLSFEENMGGRNWRSVEDTTFSPIIRSRGRGNFFGSRRRGSDYYTEMIFTWLEADGIIRRQTGGKKSIDDFAHLFYGGPNNGPEIRPYARQEVIEALNTVCPYDWAGFIQTRVVDVRPHLNDGWLEKAGWTLVYDDNPRLGMGRRDARLELLNGIGLSVGNGEIEDVQEGSPADLARLAVGMKIVSVNGRKFSPETMRKEIKDAETSAQPLRLSVDDYGAAKEFTVDYHGGLRYPHLKPISGAPDLISPVAESHVH
jgi:predicted metalloprotease with PDZ domain